ncbi:MAG: DUF3524 domain-containing protein [Kangiellaceae bacterium]|nr:DUF3524 domain-containing protein [Kangiellaceae bacterium]
MNQIHPPKPRILLISGYDAASHQQWRKILETGLPQFSWTQIALPDRYYAWRVRGNGLTLATQYNDVLSKEYDCLIVTSMVDLNSLIGFVPRLANLPCIVYCHENQFDYPKTQHHQDTANRLNAQVASIFGMYIADKVIFNSEYNQNSFYKGARKLVKKLPDGIPNGFIEDLEQKSTVIPVPIVLPKEAIPTRTHSGRVLEIVWNHRWEFDKQPEVLFEALRLFKEKGYQFSLHLLGQAFRNSPDCFESAKAFFSDEIVTWGYQPLEDYHQILNKADLVVSTAVHDFQGLSMLEAISRGCHPIAPNRVAYPAYINQNDLYRCDSVVEEEQCLCDKLIKFEEQRTRCSQVISSNTGSKSANKSDNNYLKRMLDFGEMTLLPQYEKQILQVIDQSHQIEKS